MTDDQSWKAEAACRGMDPGRFVLPLPNRSMRPGPSRMAAIDAALAVCAECPVTAECLDFALEARERHGVWGGTYLSDRSARVLRAERHGRAS
ncbi:MAG: WhiB family transcriptional regulator [Acidimicrobiales bacterium]